MADDAAFVALVVADAASTIKSYLALFALVVSGCAPELVCASFTIKILLVLVSLTKSRTAYAVLAAQSPLNVPISCVTASSPLESKANILLALVAAGTVNSVLVIVLARDSLIERSISS